jgi:hypothetical protein
MAVFELAVEALSGLELLFDLRQNAFHLFFAEGAHGLGLDVSQ